MPINTGGFQVQVMPQYAPVDPRLVAFDPTQFTKGALSSIDLMNALSARKAFEQQQADLAQTHDARIAAELAKFGITSGTAPGEIAAINAKNTGIAAVEPSATKAAIGTNEIAALGNAFTQRMMPTVQDTQRLGIEAANAAAPDASDATVAEAQLKALTAARDLAEGDTAEQKKIDAQIDLIKAQTSQATAAADYTAGRNQTSVQREEIKAAAKERQLEQLDKSYANARDTYKAIASDAAKAGGAKAIDPTGQNPQFTVAEAADAYNQGPSAYERILNHFLGADPKAPIPAGIKAQIDEYNQLKKDAADARNRMIEINAHNHQAGGYGTSSSGAAPITFSIPGAGSMPQVSQGSLQSNALANVGAPAPQAVVAPLSKSPSPGTIFTPAEAAKLPPGTIFTGTDGKQHVRK